MILVVWGSGWRSISLRPSAMRRPMATKKIGVEMTAARAEMTPHANIAARTSDSAAMSMESFHTFYQRCGSRRALEPRRLGSAQETVPRLLWSADGWCREELRMPSDRDE